METQFAGERVLVVPLSTAGSGFLACLLQEHEEHQLIVGSRLPCEDLFRKLVPCTGIDGV